MDAERNDSPVGFVATGLTHRGGKKVRIAVRVLDSKGNERVFESEALYKAAPEQKESQTNREAGPSFVFPTRTGPEAPIVIWSESFIEVD